MDKARAVEHFLYYLAHHPALNGLNRPTVLLGHTARYDAIAQAITQGSAARFNFQLQRLDLAPSDTLAQAHSKLRPVPVSLRFLHAAQPTRRRP